MTDAEIERRRVQALEMSVISSAGAANPRSTESIIKRANDFLKWLSEGTE